MKVVVVTGGIGSGKSVVCRYLNRRYGWPVYEADARVKELYQEHPTLLNDIEQSLGVVVRNSDGYFEPRLLADIIFNNADALAKVEEIVFPVLTEDFLLWKSVHEECSFTVLESATILEKPQLVGMGDIVVLIDAPLDVRTGRAACRDGVSESSVRQRMSRQKLMNDISTGEAEGPIDFMILNSGTIQDLENRIDDLVKILR